MEPMYWLIAMAILLVIEIITMGLTTIWFAAGALAAVVAALFHAPLIVQFALFLTVSVVLFCFTRPIAEKYLNNSRTKTNINSIIGEEAKVTEEIDNFNQKGAVVVRGCYVQIIDFGKILGSTVDNTRVFCKEKVDSRGIAC